MNALKQSLNRAKQTMDEKLGGAEKTQLDPQLQADLDRLDDLRTYTEKVLSGIEAYVQPDPTQRLLPGMVQEGQSKADYIGNEMSHLASRFGSEHAYGKAMQFGGESFHKLSAAEKEYLNAAQAKYVVPVKRFLNEDIKGLDNERKLLNTKRLDMDALKAKAAKNTTDAMVAQDHKRAQDAYEEQVGKVKGLVKNIDGKLHELQDHLKAFLEAHLDFNRKQHAILSDLHKAL